MSIYYFCNRIDGQKAYFDEHETGHLRVMRETEGGTVSFTDGKGFIYKGTLLKLKKSEALAEITFREEDLSRETDKVIHITAGISKWNRLSLLLEKAVELGVKKISLVKCDRSNFPKVNGDKVDKTLRKALKQCGGTVLPDVTLYDSFEAVDYEGTTSVLLNPYTANSIADCSFPETVNLFIGPEGGFSEKELETIRLHSQDLIEVSMGRRILRLETAAIVAISFIALKK
ncbi:MAG TPA: RsmE family RNA methyltransferase [Thermotogota bacterium]|nr:RsmE family RNA methyltransferase [Thermotogota bacterium]HPJ89636.1 RsmE family RNA methyltransferase [Thermotogota bacterium]HPR96813.1 RsmE family RNA methyltransferase [Thermotogota bacterium]